MNLTNAAVTAPSQKPFVFNFEKTRTNSAFPAIINGIIGARANGRRPVHREIKLGIKHKKKAVSNPKVAAEMNNRALTMEPVIN